MINSVIHGDCLEEMKRIPDRSLDMILCDLPYGTTACKWDTVIPFEPLWEQYKRIVKSNAAIVLTASQPFTSQLVMSNPKWFKYEWIWEKNYFSNFACTNQPGKNHENILVFGNGSTQFYPIREPCSESSLVRDPVGTKRHRRQNTICKTTGIKKINQTVENDGLRKPFSVQKFKKDYSFLHPTQKPVPLFEYLIKTYTNEGDLILDNCAGSGTTAIAALNTNRNYILMEKEAEYIEVINKRISGHTIQLSLAL